uniref:Ig-like domain-containing protein n=1 Tax=Stegastes partitus TaxID=144197 RepID=A0A3B5AW58_9TELE
MLYSLITVSGSDCSCEGHGLRSQCFGILSVSVLWWVCQSQVIGPSQPIVATLGDSIILPSYLKPVYDAMKVTVEWARPDLDPRFVYVSRIGQDLEHMKNPAYKGRTSMFIDELKHGNISLKLSKVKQADAGRYRCFIPETRKDTFMDLVVGALPAPVITLEGTDGKGGVVLQCESAGWYPEPELLWLDGEGKLLSAGPPETVRGPDDLYTVSSRVTVEKRHSNTFTCREKQKIRDDLKPLREALDKKHAEVHLLV